MLDEFFDASHGGRDDGAAGRHGFEDYVGEALHFRGEHEDVHHAVHLGHLGHGADAVEVVGQSSPPDPLAHTVYQGAGADQEEMEVFPLFEQQAGHVHEEGMVFHRTEVGHHSHDRVAGRHAETVSVLPLEKQVA